jgi:methylated-DNA-[protein]-cysteine S-methyltransferase
MRGSSGWVAAAARRDRVAAASLPRPTPEEAIAGLGVSVDVRLARGLPNLSEGMDCADAEIAIGAALSATVLLLVVPELVLYLSGERVSFRRHRVDLTGVPPFLVRCLLAARRIRYGQVRSYGWLAAAAGNPRAARAAGQAMARNPLPIIVPCHRVVAADGSLGGFGGGLEMKRALLELEGVLLR